MTNIKLLSITSFAFNKIYIISSTALRSAC